MDWHRPDEDFRADHHRDHRKHAPRPGDRGFSAPSDHHPPARLEVPISDLLMLVLLVKCDSTSIHDAAELIELYSRNEAAKVRLDAVAAGARP